MQSLETDETGSGAEEGPDTAAAAPPTAEEDDTTPLAIRCHALAHQRTAVCSGTVVVSFCCRDAAAELSRGLPRRTRLRSSPRNGDARIRRRTVPLSRHCQMRNENCSARCIKEFILQRNSHTCTRQHRHSTGHHLERRPRGRIECATAHNESQGRQSTRMALISFRAPAGTSAVPFGHGGGSRPGQRQCCEGRR